MCSAVMAQPKPFQSCPGPSEPHTLRAGPLFDLGGDLLSDASQADVVESLQTHILRHEFDLM